MELDFKTLPNTMEADELEKYFDVFIDHYKGTPATQRSLQNLYELAYRQWDTYEMISERVSEKISNYLIKAINQFLGFYNMMDTIISIVENLSLKNVFDYIVSKLPAVKNQSVAHLITEANEDYGDIIGNPFGVLE